MALTLTLPRTERTKERSAVASPGPTPRPTIWFQLSSRQRDWLAAAAVVLVVLPVYLRSLLPGIGYSGDSAKWSYLSEVGGVPHETGYPLFMALIQAWGTVVPIDSPAQRTNLLVALIAIVGIVVFFGLLRLIGVRRSVAAVTALIFAFSVTFWTQAMVAEVYSLHVLFLASIMVCVTRWRLGGSNRWFMAALALVAFSFGNHMSTSLIVPAVAWIAWSDRRRALTARNLAWAGGVAVLGASQYLYLFYLTRVGGYVEVPVRNLSDLWNVVTGGQFKDDMFAFSIGELLTTRLALLWRLLLEEYFVLLVPIAYGIWRGLRHTDKPRRDVLIGLSLLGLGSMVYGLNYNVDDIAVFFLPFFFVLAVFLGFGLEGVVGYVEERWIHTTRAAFALVGALTVLWLTVGLVDYPRSSQRGNDVSEPRTDEIAQSVPPGSLILTNNYHQAQFLLYRYYIDPEHFGSYDIRWIPSGRQVARYLSGGRTLEPEPGGAVLPVVHRRLNPDDPPPPIYTTRSDLTTDLKEEGLVAVAVGDSVWRIEPPPNHPAPRSPLR